MTIDIEDRIILADIIAHPRGADDNGNVTLPIFDYELLRDAAEDALDLAAAYEGRASIDAEGAIPAEVDAAIRGGKHPIAAWRRYRNMTQAALADTAGLTQAAIARIEALDPGRGRGETLDAIAKALDAPRWTLEHAIAADDSDQRADRAIDAALARAEPVRRVGFRSKKTKILVGDPRTGEIVSRSHSHKTAGKPATRKEV